VVLTIVLQTDRSHMMMTPVAGFQVGLGELMAVSGAIFLSIATYRRCRNFARSIFKSSWH
jgi:hypothetical protein